MSQTDGTTNSRAIPHMKGECILDWKPRDSYTSIADIVTKRSGLSEDELLHPKSTSPTEIENLQNAAKRIKKAVKNGEHISVMGDYDVDGITSTAILHFTLTKLGSSPFLRLPKRFSEGYGLNVAVIDEFESGLLITVDNGIAANDAVKAAKEKGLDVIVLDHHLPQEQLPCADIIVDPHVSPEKNGFVDYCGAGIAYKLAQLLITREGIVHGKRYLYLTKRQKEALGIGSELYKTGVDMKFTIDMVDKHVIVVEPLTKEEAETLPTLGQVTAIAGSTRKSSKPYQSTIVCQRHLSGPIILPNIFCTKYDIQKNDTLRTELHDGKLYIYGRPHCDVCNSTDPKETVTVSICGECANVEEDVRKTIESCGNVPNAVLASKAALQAAMDKLAAYEGRI